MTGTSGIPAAPAVLLGPQGRMALLAAAMFLVVALAIVVVWAVVDPGRYSRSGEGCRALSIANSTGGAVIHACGDHARTLGHVAFTSEDRNALLTRTQCEMAGLGPVRRARPRCRRSRAVVGAALSYELPVRCRIAVNARGPGQRKNC